MYSDMASTRAEPAGPAALLVDHFGLERDDHHRAVGMTRAGHGALAAGDELVADRAGGDAPLQPVELFDGVFHGDPFSLSPVAPARRPGQAPVVLRR